ncbi:U3 small nucleolar RNA-associated protein [Acrasis kona]|uniref:U3 small nucleolar RNA-associated protein n=1 Tax=Acrasis kona TaxID=1008807 RepID=A0AAW2YQM3_9EUKA
MFKMVVGTLRNSIEEYIVTNQDKVWIGSLEFASERFGHGTPVRSLVFSHDNTMTASVSSEECRIWNVETGSCIRTLNTGYGLSVLFVPGDKHVIVGTKSGSIELYDLLNGELLQSVKSHKGPVWTMVIRPDKKGIISASSDKTVKFYDFELIQDDNKNTVLHINLQHSLQMNQDVINICASVHSKFLAVALIDNTVKVFYLDSLKFFLSLYGHKLPVNAMSISDDETIIITASADKNVKIWGLDFGDCHRSLFAHTQPIMGVQFIPGTHYFISAGKDGCVKYWDADKYDCIQVIRPEMNHSPLWCAAISSNVVDYDEESNFYEQQGVQFTLPPRLVVSGHERAIFSYIQTDQVLFLEEEKEKQSDKQYEKELANSQQFKDLQSKNDEATHAGIKTIETIRDGEKLMEELDLCMQEEQKWNDYQEAKNRNIAAERPSANPLLMNMTPLAYTWRSLRRVRRSEVDLVLAILPYNYCIYVLNSILQLLKTNHHGVDVEYASKIALVMAQIHQTSIQMDADAFDMMESLSKVIKHKLGSERDTIGYNLSGMKFIQQRITNERQLQIIDDVMNDQVVSYRQNKKNAKAAEKKSQREESQVKRNKKGRNRGLLDAMIEDRDQPQQKKMVETSLDLKKKRARQQEVVSQKKKLKQMVDE